MHEETFLLTHGLIPGLTLKSHRRWINNAYYRRALITTALQRSAWPTQTIPDVTFYDTIFSSPACNCSATECAGLPRGALAVRFHEDIRSRGRPLQYAARTSLLARRSSHCQAGNGRVQSRDQPSSCRLLSPHRCHST